TLMNSDGTKIILYPCAKAGSYKTPASVTKIDTNAFAGAKKLTKLFIGKNITECNINLENCTALKDIIVEEGDLRKFTVYNTSTADLRKLVLPTSLVSSAIYGYNGKLEDLTIIGWTNTSAEKLAKETGAKFVSAGIVPKRVKGIKINAYVNPKRIKVSWKCDPQASGYEIYTENKRLKDIPDANITETSIYIGKNYGIMLYIRAYKIQNKKKIYGKPGEKFYSSY
ncbi:MAG: leucine-rich repeat protein, partial [Lachnospiraceae bacterium]|nr:leucine-rich repeat protein [Lachnospiraceae bacterium]